MTRIHHLLSCAPGDFLAGFTFCRRRMVSISTILLHFRVLSWTLDVPKYVHEHPLFRGFFINLK